MPLLTVACSGSRVVVPAVVFAVEPHAVKPGPLASEFVCKLPFEERVDSYGGRGDFDFAKGFWPVTVLLPKRIQCHEECRSSSLGLNGQSEQVSLRE